MHRRVLFIALFLLLGAAINVAVAWGCALTHAYVPDPFQDPRSVPVPAHELEWIVIDRTPLTAEERGFIDFTGFGAVITTFGVTEYSLATGSGFFFLNRELHTGWPLRSCSGRSFEVNYRREIVRSLYQFSPPILSGPRDIPTALLWPGFALNTLFYAAIAWLLIRGPFALRRIIRAKRGCCVKCGYDLRGQAAASDRCPECGSAHAPSPRPSSSKGEGGQAIARVAQIK